MPDLMSYTKPELIRSVTTARVLGRVTAGTGAGEQLTAAQVREFLELSRHPGTVLAHTYFTGTGLGNTTASGTPADLGDVQEVTFTLASASKVEINLSATVQPNTNDTLVTLVCVDMSGPTTVSTAATTCATASRFYNLNLPATVDLAAGTYTYRMRFQTNAGTVSFNRRTMKVTILE